MERYPYREKLRYLTRGRILYDEPMANHTSMEVGGKADCLVYPASAVEIGVIVAYLQSAGIPFLPVGNCTNLIVRDGGYRGVIICLSGLTGIEPGRQASDRVLVIAEAGVALADAVRLTAEESLTGMEFCAGIPGTIGGAIRMNAGAYGHAMQEVTEKILIVNSSGQLQEKFASELNFEYRNLDLAEGAVIVKAELSLRRGEREEIKALIAQRMDEREKKHPLHYPSAGSVFRNPVGMPAGRIIDELGLKGLQIGAARISDIHGNFIINTGGATAADVLSLMDLIQEKSLAEKGIALVPEVKIVGADHEEAV